MEGAEPRRLVPSASQVSGVCTGPQGKWIIRNGTIILSIGIVSNSVAVGIRRFGGIQWKGISGIRDAVPVVIGVCIVSGTISISVYRFGSIEGKSIVGIRNPISVIIGVRVITNPVSVRVKGLSGI